MFGDKDKSTRQVSLKTFMSTKISKETSVKDHMICIIGLFNEIEILGFEINWKTQVDMVLETLLYSVK